jgi:hypothetical protein
VGLGPSWLGDLLVLGKVAIPWLGLCGAVAWLSSPGVHQGGAQQRR